MDETCRAGSSVMQQRPHTGLGARRSPGKDVVLYWLPACQPEVLPSSPPEGLHVSERM